MTIKNLRVMGVLAFTAWTLIAITWCSTARAQDDVDETVLDEIVLTMAQACVGEVDFDRPLECLLMWRINLEIAKARGKDFVSQLRAYNSVFKVDNPRSRWVLELNLDGECPESWPEQGPGWDWVAEKWEKMIRLARAFLENPGEHPCPQATGYGGSCFNNPTGVCDHAPYCWVQVVCHKRSQRPFVQAYYATRRCR